MLTMFFSSILLILTFTTICTGCSIGRPIQSESLYPTCSECRNPELMVAPGIGFDLTLSYGTAAVRFENDSNVFIGKVKADDAFILLMMEKSNPDSRPKEPKTIPEKLRDAWERAKRRRNKSRGLPATKDVGTIANMIIQLRNMTEKNLGQTIHAAVTAIPFLPGLTREDFEDAMEYAGLKMLYAYDFNRNVDEVSAAYAGSGSGLCQHPENITSCEAEVRAMPYEEVLSISFTRFMLTFKSTFCHGAHSCSAILSEDHYELALRAENWYGSKVEYWSRVRRAIRRFVEMNTRVARLQVFGDAAGNEQFHEALRGALRDLEPRGEIHFNGSGKLEPLSLVARGAAEFAKRFQVMTWNCVEPETCSDSERSTEAVIEL